MIDFIMNVGAFFFGRSAVCRFMARLSEQENNPENAQWFRKTARELEGDHRGILRFLKWR